MNDPVTMRRQLRAELRRLRTGRALTQRHVAEQLGWSPSKLIRIENGSIAVGVTDLRALLNLYSVESEEVVNNLVEMAKGSKRQPFLEYRDVFRPETLRYFAYESSASLIRQVEPLVIPGLLQIEEYARALLASYGLPQAHTDRVWESRMERQELFERAEPPATFFIIDEGALRRAVGGPDVMQRQLDRLLEANDRQNVSIQILRFVSGAHRGLLGPYCYLEFAAPDEAGVLYLEGPRGDSVYHDDADVTGPYLEDFFSLESIATAPGDLGQVLPRGR